jgi:ABC-type multidrug transport system ATPase subunit
MGSPIISTFDLRYGYQRSTQTLHGINLQINRGDIYGFLGPNGSGKTTTLSLLLGLLKNQHGRIEFFGKDFSDHRIEILRRIGSLIESPSLYGHLTAEENLKVYKDIYDVNTDRIAEVLSLTGISQTGSKLVKNFSLGMKQRLSIALALLSHPRIMILDEPTNGLDPSGIIELRSFIKKLNKEEGITFVISSHILSEVEKMVNRVGIIYQGKMLFQGALDDLYLLQQGKSKLIVRTSDNELAVTLLNGICLENTTEELVLNVTDLSQTAKINRMLLENGIDVYALQPEKQDLEKLFIDLTTTETL